MWRVIDGDDYSYSIVHEKNILQAGTCNDGDRVTFFYNGSECHGVIVFSNRDHSKCNDELKRLSKTKTTSKPKVVEPEPLPDKRKRSQTTIFSGPHPQPQPSKKKRGDGVAMSEAEKARQRILALNKQTANRYASVALLNQIPLKPKKKDDDEEWTPPEDEASQDSLVDMNDRKDALMNDQRSILQELGNSRSSSPNLPENNSETRNANDDRETQLLKQIEELKKQLSAKESAPKLQPKTLRVDSSHKGKEKPQGSRRLFEDEINSDKDKLIKKKKSKKNGDEDDFLEGEGEKSRENGNEEIPGHDSESGVTENGGNQDDSKQGTSSDKKVKGCKEGGDEDQDTSEVNSSFGQSDDMLVDKLLGMDDSGKVNADQVRDESLEYQLYGEQSETVELGRKIFIKRDVLTKALVNVNAAHIVMRRLMQGVFIPSKIMNCTVTGQAWRPGLKLRQQSSEDNPEPLHQGALKAIVDFANGVAKKRKWKTLAFKDATSVLSGKLVEIKNQVKKGKLLD